MKEQGDTAETPNDQLSMGCRQTGKAVLSDLARRHRARADNLETFLAILPAEITKEQDEALWEIVCSLPRP